MSKNLIGALYLSPYNKPIVTQKAKNLNISFTPAQITMLSFMGLSIFGALLLMLPVANSDGQWLDPVDAFFMSVSSACVTGLAVVNIGEDFTLFGQIVVLLLIQIGGLSYMTMTTILIYMTGKKLSIGETKIFDLSNNSEAKINFKDFVIRIGLLTLTIEGIGAILLLKDSIQIADFQTAKGIFDAIFHAISAFCNAGLSLYTGSLEKHSSNYWLLFMFSILPILGGLGYTVLHEVYDHFLAKKDKQSKFIPSLHTKVSLNLTLILIIVGILIQLLLIYWQDISSLVDHSLAWSDKVSELINNFWVAFFQSCASRSSGFNSIPLTELGDPSLMFLIVWMFIGACPGGTGGGIKVTTLALAFAMMYSSLRNTKDVRLYNRSINETYQRRALVVFISTVVMIIFFTWLISIWESPKGIRFIDQLFEVTSAFTTVGLSTGITTELDDPSLIILSLCMIIGRPGPLLFLMALVNEEQGKELRYPEEGILIG